MKILLTGGSGFIGSAFRKAALSAGHEIASLTRNKNLNGSRGLTWLHGNLADAPWETIERFKAVLCVHTAWIATPGVYQESGDNYQYLDWSLAFLREAFARGIQRTLILGTCIEYAPNQPLPLSEDESQIAPQSTYARCKEALRLALQADQRFAGLNVAWGRVFYPYGVAEHPNRLPSAIVQKLLRGEKMTLRTPHSVKDYIYVDDLADAMLRVVEHGFEGTINLGTGEGVSIYQLAAAVERLLGKTGLVDLVRPPEIDPAGDIVADAAKLRDLGWHKTTTIEAGLDKLISSFRQFV